MQGSSCVSSQFHASMTSTSSCYLGTRPRWGARPHCYSSPHCYLCGQKNHPYGFAGQGQRSGAPASREASDVGTNTIPKEEVPCVMQSHLKDRRHSGRSIAAEITSGAYLPTSSGTTRHSRQASSLPVWGAATEKDSTPSPRAESCPSTAGRAGQGGRSQGHICAH